MEALERYYNEYLLGYSQDANWENYDMDMQMTKDHVEQILEAGYIDESEIDFVKSLLPEIENDRIREDLENYLESLQQRKRLLSIMIKGKVRSHLL